MLNNTIVNKVETINRCLKRIREDFADDENWFRESFTVQDAILLNLERAIQACIDAGAHVIRRDNLGIPQTSREIFSITEKEYNLPNSLAGQL